MTKKDSQVMRVTRSPTYLGTMFCKRTMTKVGPMNRSKSSCTATFKTLLIIAVLCSVIQWSNGAYVSGTIQSPEDWVFITRFCFLSIQGKINFEIRFPIQYQEASTSNPQYLLFYYDDMWPDVYKVNMDTTDTTPTLLLLYFDDQWPSVYKNNDKSCLQKIAVLDPSQGQVIYLDEQEGWSGCSIDNYTTPGYPQMSCIAERTFESKRDRWWYIVASRCNSIKPCINKTSDPYISRTRNQALFLGYPTPPCNGISEVNGVNWTFCTQAWSFSSSHQRWWYMAFSRCNTDTPILPVGVNMQYTMLMTNGDDLFHKQFSADEFYILEVDIAFLLAIALLCCCSIWAAITLNNKQMFHSTYKMYMLALFLELIHLLIECITYGKYANDGLDMYAGKTCGQVFESIGILVFILMLLLMGKGYTITRGRISKSGTMKLAIFMTLYTITYAVLFIYQAEFFDPGLVLYIYQSPAGYGLIGLRIIAWLWFCYAVFFTVKHFPKRNKFFYPFFIFYSCWFWFNPIFVLIANFGMDAVYRETVVNGVDRGVSLLGFLVYLYLTRPSNANKNFPYYLRTNQIGIMTEESAAYKLATESTYENYSGPNFTELFTVSSAMSTPRPQTATIANGNNNKPQADPGSKQSMFLASTLRQFSTANDHSAGVNNLAQRPDSATLNRH